MGCNFASLAAESGKEATGKISREEQKKLGQFLTPTPIAQFMARRVIAGLSCDSISILEPAAGTGILAAAVVEALLNRAEPPSQLHLTLFEIDERLIGSLRSLSKHMAKTAKERGVHLTYCIRNEDFLLSSDAIKQRPTADIVIANPPYFKIGANDERAVAHSYAVFGQPNIYGLFMAACASLVSAGGRWCFITPRSWTNGNYFSGVRKTVLKNLSIDSFHIFGSRAEHFVEDAILQEAMITWGTAQAPPQTEVIISASEGVSDIDDAELNTLPLNRVFSEDTEKLISLRIDGRDPLAAYTACLETYGLRVSTGPVIAFRAKQFLEEGKTRNSVPLLWLQHINHLRIQWPIEKKLEHIRATAASASLLVENSPMVILRRFSPKEDERRVTAAAYVGGLPGLGLGLENHLNYIYRPGGKMTPEEALGIAAYLNSQLVDEHFRATAGSTQVNASELRKLPLPPLEDLLAIGASLRPGVPLREADRIVESILGLAAVSDAAA
ncbi:Eco57I restriction-modification methylase domain-containing protein [Ferrovibrio sp.]|uniref:Eco57I restriction-modification methylase domain-containing protein n=1 Tax=Ferrovibrio sp. TaxID=1917215 RepID=UPI003D2DE64B